jgi:hypothetical protein
MNANSFDSSNITDSGRCQHIFDNGKRCRMLLTAPGANFCTRHARLGQNHPIEEDFREKLLKNSQDFQTAQGINFALGNLYDLVAQNRISTRRAAVLAYISSLLLRTLPAIDYDRQANIKDPALAAKPKVKFESVTELMLEPDPTKKPS